MEAEEAARGRSARPSWCRDRVSRIGRSVCMAGLCMLLDLLVGPMIQCGRQQTLLLFVMIGLTISRSSHRVGADRRPAPPRQKTIRSRAILQRRRTWSQRHDGRVTISSAAGAGLHLSCRSASCRFDRGLRSSTITRRYAAPVQDRRRIWDCSSTRSWWDFNAHGMLRDIVAMASPRSVALHG